MLSANMIDEGKQYDFWASSHMVYGTIVLIVNVTLLRLFNNWTGYGEILIAISILSFWFIMWFEDHFEIFTVLYKVWKQFTTDPSSWLGYFFMLGWALTVEDLVKWSYQKLRSRMSAKLR
jgi:hypothetical protein